MKNYYLLIAAFILSVNSYAQSGSTKPYPTFIVTVNQKEYKVSEGEELKVDSDNNESIITVKLAEYNRFDNGTIFFDYPSNFSFEFEDEVGLKSWSLDGSDFIIMYFEIEEKTELDDFVLAMVSQFGEENCKVEKTQKKLGGSVLKGKRIFVSLVGTTLTIDFMEVEMGDSTSRFISFQDVLDEQGAPSKEGVKTWLMIEETFGFKRDKN
jgi:hypothetical protein